MNPMVKFTLGRIGLFVLIALLLGRGLRIGHPGQAQTCWGSLRRSARLTGAPYSLTTW